MLVNMKKPVELEPPNKIDEFRRFSNKELRLLKKSMGTPLKSSEDREPIRKKSYHYVSGIVGMRIILSSKRIYVIVTSITNKLCC